MAQVDLAAGEPRLAVDPGDHLSGAAGPGDSHPVDTEPAFIRGPDGVYHRVVVFEEFRVPAVQVVSILGVLSCGLMIFGLGWTNWSRLGVWLAIGLVVYFLYGIKHSKLRTRA